VAPHTAKIHTLITLGIRHRAKPLVLKARKHRPCGFDSHPEAHSLWVRFPSPAPLLRQREATQGDKICFKTLIRWESLQLLPSQSSVRNSVNRVAVPSDKARPFFGKYLLRAAQELPK
jgi:hypothetical protein